MRAEKGPEYSVRKQKNKLKSFTTLSVGCTNAWLALACGDIERDPASPVADPPPIAVVRETCADNPYLAECPPLVVPDAPMETPPTEERGSAVDLARAQAQNVLLANCGGCHGTQLTPETARSRMNYINDMAKLVANQKVLPLNSEASPIIRRMRDGSMPPPDEGGQRVNAADIALVANFIDNPLYWPDVIPTVCENRAVDFDRLYEAVANDLRRQEADDAAFSRYVSLANRANSGVCTNAALDLERQAITKLMNMLSIRAKVGIPLPVNEEQTLYRVDLRDFEWNRAVTVNGQVFDDVWEAVVAANVYAVPLFGEEADDARAEAQTDVPVMFLDSMLNVAAVGELYYAIIDVDVTQPLDTFVLERLGIDVLANLDNEDLIRAGTTRSRVSRQDRVVERHDIAGRPGAFYQSFDFEANVRNDSIFQNPFGFSEGGREVIFTLPNGMLAYLIADAAGNLVEDSNILLDTSQDNYRAVTAVSCASCHVTGLITMDDEVRDVVLSNALTLLADGTLSQEQLEQLKAVYLEPAEFARRLEDDTKQFYQSALTRANLPIGGAEQVSNVFLRFARDLSAKEAAGDLGMDEEQLLGIIQLLDPELGVLRRSTIDRNDFTALYVASLCTTSGVLRNQPDAALCEQALLGIGD
jgi:mono/diheme cytochrome c family protein